MKSFAVVTKYFCFFPPFYTELIFYRANVGETSLRLFLLTHDNFSPKFSILVRSKCINISKLITGHTISKIYRWYFINCFLQKIQLSLLHAYIYITEVLKSPKSICFITSCTSKHSIKRIWVGVCIIQLIHKCINSCQ